jgi:hypothetical protein
MNFIEITATFLPRGEPILAPYAVTRETHEAAEMLRARGFHFEMSERLSGDFALEVVRVGEQAPEVVARVIEHPNCNMAEALARLVAAALKAEGVSNA